MSSTVVSIGNFDGVHLGHQAVIKKLKALSEKYEVPSTVITFDPHPRVVLGSSTAPRLIYDIDTRIKALKYFGIEQVRVVEFNQELLQLKAGEFLDEYIGLDSIAGMVQGSDFAFGYKRHCNIDCLQLLGNQYDFQVKIVNKTDISSSQIRDLLVENYINKAYQIIGKYFYNYQPVKFNVLVKGKIVYGNGYGRELEAPTANLDTMRPDIADGIYAGLTNVKGQTYVGALSVKGGKVEVHVIGYKGDLYDECLSVRVNYYLRPYQQYDQTSELIAQIKRDLLEAWNLLHDKIT